MATTPPSALDKNNPREMRAWTMYDWANSVYSLVISTALFPIYYSETAPEVIRLFGMDLPRASVFSYAVSLAFLVQVLFSPLLSGIADAKGLKRTFLLSCCLLGSTCCVGLFFFTGSTVLLGLGMFIGASIGYAMGDVFYNSFLPEVASEEHYDTLSAKGYTLGYIGSVILMVVALALAMLGPEYLNIPSGTAVRIGFMLTGIWWAFFGIRSILRLRQRPSKPHFSGDYGFLLAGFRELGKALAALKTMPAGWRFLLTFLFYNTTIQTVMYVASIYGKDEMHLDSGNLIMVLLIIQLIAIPGALIMARVSERYGNTVALRICVAVWILICIAAWLITKPIEFYLLAAVVGFVMGGIQSTSRAMYTKLLPEAYKTEAALFSFYSVTDKVCIIIGTLIFGLMREWTGSMRTSILVMIVWLAVGFVLLSVLPWRKLAGDHKTLI